MDFATYRKCVALYKLCDNEGPLYLHNFGEPLLNPMLPDFVEYATRNDVEVSFFTNGVDNNRKPFSLDVWEDLYQKGLRVVNFSEHIMKADVFEEEIGHLININRVFTPRKKNLHNWAGQTENPLANNTEQRPCIFETSNAMVILWNGRISTCCIDSEGMRSNIYVEDILSQGWYAFTEIELCKTCSLMRNPELI